MMRELNVLLACGMGASSGFMAQKIKKAAAAREIEMRCTARPESLIESYIDGLDIVVLAPHLKAEHAAISERCEKYNVPVIVIDSQAYGMLDGDRVLSQILEYLDA